MGETYLALHTLRCRSRATQHRLADGHRLGPDTSIDKVLLASAEQRLYDTARDLLPGAIELDDTDWRTEYPVFAGGHHLRRNRRSAAQHHRPPPAGPREGVSVDHASHLELLEDRAAQDHAVGLRRRAGRGAGRTGLGRHADRHARAGDAAGVPAARRNRLARLGSQRCGAARDRRHDRRRWNSAAALRRRLLGGVGPRSARRARPDARRAAAAPGGRGRSDPAAPRPGGRWAGGWSAPPGRCWHLPASMRWTGCSSAARSRASRRSGTDWPRRWWPSRAPRRR